LRYRCRTSSAVVLITSVLVSLAGHYGGELVYGEGYLFGG